MNNDSKSIQAIIFDMDGLLIDSMMHWINSDKEFLKKYGIDLTDEMTRYFSGRSEAENTYWVKNNFNLKHSVEELIAERFLETELIYTQKTNLLPGANKIIEIIKKNNIKQAIASGTPRRLLDKAVERFGWNSYMDVILSADDIGSIGKPNPLIYLKTAEKLNVEPERCIVFEDAENGVIAAKEAKMKCIAIPNKLWSIGDFSRADLIVDSLEDNRIYKYLNIDHTY